MNDKLTYDREIVSSLSELTPEHAKIVHWVGMDKKILEVACHTGYFSAALKKQNCHVTGVEINADAIKKAAPFLDKAIVGSIEDEKVWSEIEEEKYDVVLFMHVLEHLVNADRVLSRAKKWVKDNGIVVICLPNINNWTDRIKIFKGKFDYTNVGVMDETHLKFYNYFTAQQFIERSGFQIVEYFGESQKAKFKIFPSIRIIGRLNLIVNKMAYKLLSPNLTDQIIVFKIKKTIN